MEISREKKNIPFVRDGDVFKIGGMEFIKFPDKDGKTPVVMKNIAFTSRFGDNNNLKESVIQRRMEDEILPKIIAAIGEENVCTFETDLTTIEGLKPYGDLKSKISLPTLDFYRANVEIFDLYNPLRWWWLATPFSTPTHANDRGVLCVSPSGCILNCGYGSSDIGVRPFCILNSSIFESSEE